MIKAPYNFVPLNKEIFYPSWAKDVSHDAPFRDGESGEIELTITAKSPIFVRDSKDETKFCNFNGRFFIPATSIKGAIRSVLEIISFSKLRKEEFSDKTYAVRDMSKAENFYMTQMKKIRHCGWLKKDGNNYKIEDCGIPGRIHQEDIDRLFGVEFSSLFKVDTFDDKDKTQKTAKFKYDLLKGKNLTSNFTFSHDDANRKIYLPSKSGDKGTIVVTGQASARVEKEDEKSIGKIYEFIFFEPKQKNIIEVTPKKDEKIDDTIMENFKFAYFDGRKTEPKESPDWAYWKEELENGEKIPVFFQLDEHGKLLHFGLSYLYKLPYDKSIGAGIKYNNLKDYQLDLAQTMFGYVDKNRKEALKGRVYFSHFLATENITELKPVKEILGTPRPSYYPNYIRQDGIKLKTYMDNFEIAGRKRYPIKNGISTTKFEPGLESSDEVTTTFTPLKEGAKFSGSVKFHNLKKAEIGALISAITFHNVADTFHNLGFAKPYGYGKVKFKITNLSDEKIKEYLSEFEKEILIQIPKWGDLNENSSLLELFAMASSQNNAKNLEYMKLKEFAAAKTNGEYLKKYTKTDGVKFDISKFKLNLKSDELDKINQDREMLLKWQKAKNRDNIDILNEFIEDFPQSPFIEEATKKVSELKEKALLEKQELEKQKKLEKDNEAEQNWDKITSNKKYEFYKESIEKHIENYQDHPTAQKAKEELERLIKESKKIEIKLEEIDVMEILSLNKLEEIEKFLEKTQKLDIESDDKNAIIEHLIGIYKENSSKKQSRFKRKAKLTKIFTKKEIDDIFG